MRHRIGLNADSVNPEFFAFNDRRARAAKRIEYALPALEAESLNVIPNQMRRKREDESIPPVRRTVSVLHLIEFHATLARKNWQKQLGHLEGGTVSQNIVVSESSIRDKPGPACEEGSDGKSG
jgi:hypothetical protein